MNMKTFILAVSITALASGCSSGSGGEDAARSAVGGEHAGRYHIKSGTLTYEANLPQDMGTNKRVVYFDDYGQKEKMVTITSISMMGQNIDKETHLITQDGFSYTWSPGETSGMKVAVDDTFDPAAADFSRLTEEAMAKYGLTKEGDETIDGRKCDVWAMDNQGVQGKVWIWNNIPVKTSANMMGFSIIEKLVSLDEGDVDQAHFVLPDLTWKDMTYQSVPGMGQ